MANIILYKANALAAAGVILKNGTGGGAPALSQNADWPMSNLLLQDRYSVWRSVGDGVAPVSIDFDLGSSQTIVDLLITNRRFYGLMASDTALEVYYDNVYPPTTWLDDTTFNAQLNDSRFVIGAASGRYWRFDIYPPPGVGQALSCKLWIGRSADKVTLTHDWSLETRFANQRLRDELRTPSGLLYSFEPAISIASNVREASLVLRTASQSDWDTLRDTLSGLDSRFLISDSTGLVWETSLPGGKIAATRRFNGLYEIELELEQHP